VVHLHVTESTEVYLAEFAGLAGLLPVSLVLPGARRPPAIDIQSVWTVVGPKDRPLEAVAAAALRPS